MRPYIICHMVASVDGRIDCGMVDQISGDEYYSTLESLNCPSLLEGRVTMEHYCAAPEPFVPIDNSPTGHPSVHVAVRAATYMIAVDTRGRLSWPTAEIDGAPLICIVSELAPEEYLETLRRQGISWICTGAEAIDLPRAMEMLRLHFGVERLALLGGGHINGGFLEAGLIDEISLLIAPGIDGREGRTALFDGIKDNNRLPTSLTLKSVEPQPNGTIWVRYLTAVS